MEVRLWIFLKITIILVLCNQISVNKRNIKSMWLFYFVIFVKIYSNSKIFNKNKKSLYFCFFLGLCLKWIGYFILSCQYLYSKIKKNSQALSVLYNYKFQNLYFFSKKWIEWNILCLMTENLSCYKCKL